MKDSSEFETGALYIFFFIYEGFIWACEQNKRLCLLKPVAPTFRPKTKGVLGRARFLREKNETTTHFNRAVSLFAIQPFAEEANSNRPNTVSAFLQVHSAH